MRKSDSDGFGCIHHRYGIFCNCQKTGDDTLATFLATTASFRYGSFHAPICAPKRDDILAGKRQLKKSVYRKTLQGFGVHFSERCIRK